ncbi:MAG: hypothetical protein V3R16_09615 [Nitrospirales bacterium]
MRPSPLHPPSTQHPAITEYNARMDAEREMARRARLDAAKPFECMECGVRLTAMAAEYAAFGDFGCPSCGGSDIDEAVA